MSAKQKAEEKAMEANTKTKGKGMKKPKKPKMPKQPTIESTFIIFMVNLSLVKSLLFKYGYALHWPKWDLIDIIDTAFLLMVKGYEI